MQAVDLGQVEVDVYQNTAKSSTFTISENARAYVGPFEIFAGTFDEALRKLREMSDEPDRQLVVTCNVDQAINLTQSDELWNAYKRATMITLDGAPLVTLSRILGARNIHRITGADLLPAVCASEIFDGKRIVVTGGRDEVVQMAAQNLNQANSNIEVVAVPFPLLNSVEDNGSSEVVHALIEFEPHIVFLCLGSPKQEAWYLHWAAELPNAVYVGVGAAVDFASGSMSRAPRWMQDMGLEWTYRLMQEPQRLAHRYLVKGRYFIPIVSRSLLRRAFQRLAIKS